MRAKRFVSVVMSAVFASQCVWGNGMMVHAAEKISKEETVFVNLTSDAEIDMITVTDHLKNVSGTSKVTDYSTLSNIKNEKGNESFEQKDDGTLVWEAQDKDITYSGNTDQQLPVGVKFQYLLDGKEIKADELIGKSGELKIKISYANDTNYQAEQVNDQLVTPFTMFTALILPTDIFSDIEVSQGKIMEQGANSIVIAYGMPGFVDSLSLDEDAKKDIEEDLSSEVTITAKVEKFELSSTYTLASTELFQDIELGENESLKDLEKALDELVDASDKMVTGTSEFSDGIGKLKKGFDSYAKGVKALNKGAGSFAANIKELNTGLMQYSQGVDSMLDNTGKYVDSAAALCKNYEDYINGMTTVYGEAKKVFANNVLLSQEEARFSQELASYIDEVNQTMTIAMDAPTWTDASYDASGVQTVLDGIAGLTAEEKNQILQAAEAAGTTAVANQNQNVRDALSSANASLNEKAVTIETKGQGLKQGSEALSKSFAGNAKHSEAIGAGMESLGSQKGILTSYYDALIAGGNQLKQAIQTFQESPFSMETVTQSLSQASSSLTAGIGSIDKYTKSLTKGVSALQKGGEALAEGEQTFKTEGTQKMRDQYNDKVGSLIKRVDGMSDGADAYQSFSGISKDMDGSVKFIFVTDPIAKDKK